VSYYRAAIVGTGAIADAHARAVRAAGTRVRLVAAVDVDVQRAKAFAEAWDIPDSYAEVGELLADGDVDLVQVCTPPRWHVPVAVECLDAGVPVLVEKPPALSLAEVDELVAAQRRTGVPVACVFQHRFGSGAGRLRRLAAAGVLGRPLLATCHTLWYRDDAYFGVPWRGSWSQEGGGPTMGHGIHQFDLLLSVLGRWERVSAVAARLARPTETEDVSLALVELAGGAVASVVNSLVSPRETSALRFDYEHATVEVEHLYGYRDADWTVTPAPGRVDVAAAWADGGPDVPSGHEAQLLAVLDALDRGEAPPVTLEDARDTMEFVAALYASAFGGVPVRRGEIEAGSPFAARMDGTGAPWAPLGSGLPR
jgi:predicted dehydrogenase